LIQEENNYKRGGAWWFAPVIPTIQEAEIRRIAVQGQPEQKISETLSQQVNQVFGVCL
jgi:hypothetical protein